MVPGDHVVLSFDSCGSCPSCSLHNPSGCYNLNPLNLKNSGFAPGRLDGSSSFTDAQGNPVGSHFFGQSSFASHSVVTAHSAVKVDKGLELETLGPAGTIIAVDKHHSRLELAAKYGATHGVSGSLAEIGRWSSRWFASPDRDGGPVRPVHRRSAPTTR